MVSKNLRGIGTIVALAMLAGCSNSTSFRSTGSRTAVKNKKADADGSTISNSTPAPVDPNENKLGASKTMQLRTVERDFTAGILASTNISQTLPRSKVGSTFTMTGALGDPSPQPGSVAETLARSVVSSNVTMAASYATQNSSFVQVTRQRMIDTLKQGGSSSFSQTFNQLGENTGPIDILIVIDNSLSMAEEQTKLASKLSPLLASLSNADWQISVVTTDSANGCQRALIRKGDANYSQAFSTAISGAGTAGSGNERGILMAVAGLKGSFKVPGNTPGTTVVVPSAGTCPTSAQTWVRAGAPIVVLIVSDEDNCSNNGSECPATDPWKYDSYLYDYLSTIRNPGVDARVYAIDWIPNTVCATGANVATQYNNIVTRTKGLSGSICDADYTNTLNRISQDAASILKNQFSLTNIPDSGSSKVYVDNVLTNAGWNMVNGTLTFTTIPSNGAVIRVEYVVSSSSVLADIQLSQPAAAETIVLKVNGAVIPASAYSYAAATNKISYRAPDLANIQVDYRMLTPALQSSFTVGQGATASSLVVKVNNVIVSNYALNAATGVITFSAPPQDSASISASFQKSNGNTLVYPFVIPATVDYSNLEASISGSTTAVPFTFLNNAVTFAAADFVEGLVVKISYRSRPKNQAVTLLLPFTPVSGSLSVVSGGVSCPPAQYTLTGTSLVVNCDPGATDYISASYMYLDPSLVGTVVLSKVLQYPLPVPSTVDAKYFKAVIDGTADEIPVSWNAGIVTVDAANFVMGRVIRVSYLGRTMGGTVHIPLAQTPIPTSLVVMAGATKCAAGSYTVSASELLVTCDASAADAINVAFNYLSSISKTFAINDVVVPDSATWVVSIDGTLAAVNVDYSRVGNVVTVLKSLTASSKINIVVNFMGE